MENKSGWRQIKNTILVLLSLFLVLFTAYAVLASGGIHFGHSHWSLLFVILIDAYWLWVLIDAARFSREDSLPANKSAFPKRLVGLLLFFACFCFEICAFGMSYFEIREQFKNSSQEILPNLSSSLFMSFGTMTTIDIVDYSPATDWAKSLKSFQVVSNLLMLFAIFPVLLARLSTFKDAPLNEQDVTKRDTLKEYSAGLIGKPFTASTIEEYTGIAPDIFCKMSGLFSNIEIEAKREKIEIAGTYPELLMKYDDTKIKIILTFYVQNKIVKIEELLFSETVRNVDHKIYDTIKRLSKKAKFKKIIFSIVKDNQNNSDYIRWSSYFQKDGSTIATSGDGSVEYRLLLNH